MIQEFWEGVLVHCGQREKWLVVMFTGSRAGYPPPLVPLPHPAFASGDIEAWTRQLVAFRRWPATLAEPWRDLILEEASDGSVLDIRSTFEVLEDTIRRIRFDDEKLRRELERRSR